MAVSVSLDEVRRHHRRRLNDALRRPGMYGRDEIAERLLIEDLAVAEGSLDRWHAEHDRMRELDAFTSTGVRGAYSRILPDNARRCAVASVYAEAAHRCGWLDVDRILSGDEFRRMREDIAGWVTRDRTLAEAIEAYGKPSLLIGSNNPYFPMTLVYAADELICVHLWNQFDHAPRTPLHGVHPEPVVLAVRHRPGPFRSSFSFTPEGLRRRPEEERNPGRATVT
jgi:hypothetical protein